MDPVRNPFSPGAGSPPPALTGRNEIIHDATVSIRRILIGKPAQSSILIGKRGVGKTVILGKIQQIAEQEGCLVSAIEAPDGNSLAPLLAPKIRRVLNKLSLVENARDKTRHALAMLRNFASVFKVTLEGVDVTVNESERGLANSGDIESDLIELFQAVGEAAKSAQSGWVLTLDEVQYLSDDDAKALIAAVHICNQRLLPVLMFAAGLPSARGVLGAAKSYSERLFSFANVDALPEESAKEAVRLPIEAEGETIAEEALKHIVSQTHGYPYFLQEWGYQAWNTAALSPIDHDDLDTAEAKAIKRLDEGFFSMRLSLLTNAEKEYVAAMAQLDNVPYKTSDISTVLRKEQSRLTQRRDSIIKKGIIFSPSYGTVDFTVPMFASFIRRRLKTGDL